MDRDLAIFCLVYEALRRKRQVERPLLELGLEEILAFGQGVGASEFAIAAEELDKLGSKGISVLPVLSPEFPAILRTIPGAPNLLYLRGALPKAEPVFAIVGSRSCSIDGREFSFTLARQITEAGGIVVSGLAYGCDAAAHRGALSGVGGGGVEGGGPESWRSCGVAVLGSGVLNIYPGEHSALADEMLRHGGAIISECHPLENPRKGSFPARNRIISGLSVATIVIEASEKSGSLITARLAAEQGREVFSVPGSVFSPRAHGTNSLIRDGARILTSFEDLKEFFPKVRVTSSAITKFTETDPLLAAIADRALTFDELKERLNLPAATLLSQITLHELEGRVRCQDGSVYLVR